MSTDITNIDQAVNEPTAPIPTFKRASEIVRPNEFPNDIRIQGDRQREQDLKDYKQDLEDRRQRGAEIAAKRIEQSTKPEVNVVAELDKALAALEAGADDFQNSFGKANQPLIDAKMEVDRLRHELSEAQQRLDEIESKGDSVDRLKQSVLQAERALNGLLSQAESQAMDKLISEKFGWLPNRSKIQRETLREMALDISVQSLKEFALPRHHDLPSDPTELQKRLEIVGQKLTDLRGHLEQE